MFPYGQNEVATLQREIEKLTFCFFWELLQERIQASVPVQDLISSLPENRYFQYSRYFSEGGGGGGKGFAVFVVE